MGEKPLNVDEAPQQAAVTAGGPPGGFDVRPPISAAAGSINTTRSNIKNQGAVAHDPSTDAGDGDAVTEAADGTDHAPDAGGMAIKEQGVVKSTTTGQGPSHTGGTVKSGGNMVAPGPTDLSDLSPPAPDPGGAAVGPVRPGSPGPTYPDDTAPGAPAGGKGSTGGMAAEGDPIPGIDVKLGKNPGSR